MRKVGTRYFCSNCFKTYMEYYDGKKFTNAEGKPLTRVYGKCDTCGGELVVD